MTASALEKIQAFLVENQLSSADENARILAKARLGLADELLEEFFGYGPLQPFFADPSVTEILVRGHAEIWVERNGILEETEAGFHSEESLRRLVRRALSRTGRKVDHLSPFADAMLENGARLHVAIPPLSRTGITLSIRKPRPTPFTLKELERSGFLSLRARTCLENAVNEKKNILVSGGTGAGKTSLLAALIGTIPPHERVILLEDIGEINALHPHIVGLEARAANQDNEGEISLRRLLKEALRMRPDRLVIGECRGNEALDLLMALHTGHRGSLGTIHANSPRDALTRLELLALLGCGQAGGTFLKQLACSAIQLIVHIERQGARRAVASVVEVKGVDDGRILLKELDLS